MKRILFALILVPTLASADSLSWSTYCDNGVEKVRCMIVLNMPGVQFGGDAGAGIRVYNDEVCFTGRNECDSGRFDADPVALGNDDFEFTFEGWLRSCLTVDQPTIDGYMFYYTVEPGQEPVRRFSYIICAQFEPTTIVDTVDCAPLPTASTTWGAIKALYRSEGAKQ